MHSLEIARSTVEAATASQIRAARALLDMTQDELALLSGVTRKTLARLEKGEDASRGRTAEAVIGALTARGVTFIDQDENIGVSVKR